MGNNFLTLYFSDHTIRAICWTLVHSLWIGLIVAALAGLVISTTKKASSHLRYQLLCSILVLFVGVIAFIFYRELNSAPNNPVVGAFAGAGQSNIIEVRPAITGTIFRYDSMISLLDKASPWIVAVWLVCFVFKGMKLTRELIYVRRARRVGIVETDEDWIKRAAVLGKKLGIRRAVQLFESELVNIPVTIGYFKPVILLPLGMLLQLSPAQVESILYHELAHILRRDYLVNILQSVVETLFFFNPAIWWLSALIREERETCCDDIVLEHVQQKRNYLEALMAFQGYESPSGNYSMGLSLRPHQLMNRLRRMVNQENKRLNAAEKIILLSGMLLLMVFTFIPKADSEIRHSAAFIKKHILGIVHNDAPGSSVVNTAPSTRQPEHRRSAKNPVSTVAYQDSSFRVTSIRFVHTDADTANEEMYVTDSRDNHYHLKVADSKLIFLEINGAGIAEGELSNYESLLRRINQAFKEAQQAKAAHAIAAKDQSEEVRAANATHPGSGPGKQAFKKKAQPVTEDGPAGLPLVTHNKKSPQPSASILGDQQRIRGVIAALVSEKVVSDPAAVDWFGLTETEFIVNGEKQSEALHQKLKTLYGIHERFGLYYGPVKMTGTGVFMDKKDVPL